MNANAVAYHRLNQNKNRIRYNHIRRSPLAKWNNHMINNMEADALLQRWTRVCVCVRLFRFCWWDPAFEAISSHFPCVAFAFNSLSSLADIVSNICRLISLYSTAERERPLTQPHLLYTTKPKYKYRRSVTIGWDVSTWYGAFCCVYIKPFGGSVCYFGLSTFAYDIHTILKLINCAVK